MANTFIPELSAIRRQDKGLGADDELILTDDDWVVYWIDGYASHLTYHTSLLCDLNHITLYCFKAHSSHICQPNDVGPFKPLKNEWRKAVTEWRVQNPYATLNKVNFAAVLSVAVQKLDSCSVIAGYRSTGLYPFDEDALHYERLTATNQHKHDSEAFSTPQQELSANEIALNVIENILGSNIVSQFKQVQNSDVVDLSVIPSVHTYIIWKHLSELVQGSAVDQQLELNSYFPQSNEQNVLLLIPDLPSGDHWRPLEVDPVQPYPFPQVCVTSAVDDAIQQCLSTEPVVAEDPCPSVSSPSEAVQTQAAEPVVAEPVVAEGPGLSVSSPSETVQTEAAEPVVAEDPGLSVSRETAEPVVAEPVVAQDPGPLVSSTSETVQTEEAEPVRSTIELMKPTNGDVCLRDEKTLSPSNSKLKRGVPIWFSGKVSPAFDKHIFWPSPEKKRRKCDRKLTELFPACASSQEWRNRYKQKELSRSKGRPKANIDIGASAKQERSQKHETRPSECKKKKTRREDQQKNKQMNVQDDNQTSRKSKQTSRKGTSKRLRVM